MEFSTDNLKPQLNKFIDLALEEDVREGDHSSNACIPADMQGKARLMVKDEGILAGMEVAEYMFSYVDAQIKFNSILNDGDRIHRGDIAFYVEGNVRTILKLERLVLNCMQRMSGIATRTRQLVDLMEGTRTRLLDTRKTTPNMRFLEKWAVKIGGGENHRFGLYDMVMLKDNHVDSAGGIAKAINSVQEYFRINQLALPVEVETRSLEEVRQVLECGGITRIMLDNYSPEELKEALTLIGGRFESEASGGITDRNIREYAETGVDYISSSQMTHSVKSLDLSLKIIKG